MFTARNQARENAFWSNETEN